MRRIKKIDLRGMAVWVHWLREKPAWAPRRCENGCLDQTRTPWRIWVSTIGSEASQRDSLCHEIGHAILESSGVDTLNLRRGYQAEENLVHRFTGGILDFLERNPELVAELSKKGG
jgi:hypothetical protein